MRKAEVCHVPDARSFLTRVTNQPSDHTISPRAGSGVLTTKAIGKYSQNPYAEKWPSRKAGRPPPLKPNIVSTPRQKVGIGTAGPPPGRVPHSKP